MEFNKDTEEKLDELEYSPIKSQIFIAVSALAIVLITAVSFSYIAFMNDELFKLRNDFFTQYTEVIENNVEERFENYWEKTNDIEYLLGVQDIESRDDLMDAMSGMDYFCNNDSYIIAFNENEEYYSSDYTTGNRADLSEVSLNDAMEKRQHLIVEIFDKDGNNTYYMFVNRLDNPIVLENDENICHIALAVYVEEMHETLSPPGFENNCYAYLLNKTGSKLYKTQHNIEFIREENVILSLSENATIQRGATIEQLVNSIQGDEILTVELEYKEKRWFASCTELMNEGYIIVLLVPSEMLSVDTTNLLRGTLVFSLFLILVIMALFLSLISYIKRTVKKNKELIINQKRANILLKKQARLANNANKSKSEFLSYMSHDIRTPINGIMGMTNIAIKNIDNKNRVMDCLKKINQSSNHLSSLINDILDMSRIESGKTKIEHKLINVYSIVSNCAVIVEAQLMAKNIEFVKDYYAFEHSYVLGDELHLRQILINILGNAIKFTPEGGRIKFTASETKYNEGRVSFKFEVEDTGVGMSEEFQKTIWEPFTQADRGANTEYKGTGLGMSITKKFVDLMGGRIELESRLGEGSKFTVYLTFEVSDRIRTGSSVNLNSIDIEGMNILVAEDNDLNREIVTEALASAGAMVTECVNGCEAVRMFNESAPGTYNAVLMDVMMPEMDGISATKKIRASNRPDRNVPVIAMTARAYDEDKRETRIAGMNAHVSKPLNVDELYRVLNSFKKKKRQVVKKADYDLKGKHILLVDDNMQNLEIGKTILEEYGVTVTVAESGRLAVELFEKESPGTFDAILMDIKMPEMDGIETTKIIRGMETERDKKVVIIAMTADIYRENSREAKAAGMNGYLCKPIDVSLLKKNLSECQDI